MKKLTCWVAIDEDGHISYWRTKREARGWLTDHSLRGKVVKLVGKVKKGRSSAHPAEFNLRTI